MITTLAPALVAASAAEAPAWMMGALPPSIAATILVLPPTPMSSTSSASAVKYPASLAIHVVAQLAAKLGYKSGNGEAQNTGKNDPLANPINVISESNFKNIVAALKPRYLYALLRSRAQQNLDWPRHV